MIDVSLRLAWRNLWRYKRRTWLTVGAMIFSNALLVFSVSLQFGSYDMMINNTLQAFTGHIQVQHEGYQEDPKMRRVVADIVAMADDLRSALGSNEVAARGAGFALASSTDRSYGLQILGVEPGFEPNVSTIPGLVKQGRYLNNDSYDEIVIGSVLARNLKVALGDEITFLGSGRDDSFAAGVAKIVGIFETGSADIDRNMAQVSLAYFQDSFAMEGSGHSIVLRAENIDGVPALRARVEDQVAGNDKLVVLDWETLQPGLKQAIRADMTSAWFMYSVLIVLVAFSVLNTQLMSVLERTREFGTMMALGLKPSRLARLVMTETALMAGLGLAIGVLTGFIITYYLSVVGFSYPGMEEMAARFNLPDRMYPSVSMLSLVLGPGIVALGCLLAAVYPALRLYVLLPIEAMRAV
ncbi:MAG: FtsX-like permease family protein [Gammaproteobacteria bacterium]|nr:FtsX-like permease family protein [Gammaproteobacteria bacterium]MCZ6798051.1 FtsX-like permease family protein [Gammaproteobacteria bacterium]MCZ6882709.1 FtsX-like permease family protein [Gammaproteobacteria bacterium]